MTANNKSGGKVYRYPKITVGMTDKDVIEKISELWKVKVQNIKNKQGKKPIYRVSITGCKAVQWMLTLHSFMGIRRKQRIEFVLQEWKRKIPTNQSRKISCQKSSIGRIRDEKGRFLKI